MAKTPADTAADASINYQRITDAIARHQALQRDLKMMLAMIDSAAGGNRCYLAVEAATAQIPADTATAALQALVVEKTAEAEALAAALDNLAKGLPL